MSIVTSQELSSQEYDACTASATDHELSTKVRRLEPAEHTVVSGEQQLQSSHESSVASVGTPSNEQHTVSKTNVMTRTEYNATDIERSRSDLAARYVVQEQPLFSINLDLAPP